MSEQVDVFFNGEKFDTVDNDDAVIQKTLANHFGTWAGNGRGTAKILGKRPVPNTGLTGWIMEVESRRGAVYTIHTYRVSLAL